MKTISVGKWIYEFHTNGTIWIDDPENGSKTVIIDKGTREIALLNKVMELEAELDKQCQFKDPSEMVAHIK